MYGENLTQGTETQARRRWRSDINRPPRRFKQRGLYQPITQGNKTALRRCYAIQHIQQRVFTGFLASYEPEKRLDICRSASKSKSRIVGSRFDRPNSPRAVAKQSMLVWSDLACSRQYNWLRDKCGSLASRSLCKVATKIASLKKSLSPCCGHIDHSIYPCGGQIALAIYPCYGLIRGVFDTFLYPPYGHLLDIPLYIAIAGGIKHD